MRVGRNESALQPLINTDPPRAHSDDRSQRFQKDVLLIAQINARSHSDKLIFLERIVNPILRGRIIRGRIYSGRKKEVE